MFDQPPKTRSPCSRDMCQETFAKVFPSQRRGVKFYLVLLTLLVLLLAVPLAFFLGEKLWGGHNNDGGSAKEYKRPEEEPVEGPVDGLVDGLVEEPKVPEDVECLNTPPGVKKLLKGVDITELDLMPIDISGTGGFKSPIMAFTCNEEREFVRGTKGYTLPDQIWQMTSESLGWLGADVQLYKTSKDVRSKMTMDVSGHGSIWNFAFSASRTYTKMQTAITGSARYISDVSRFHSSTRVDLWPHPHLQVNSVAQDYLSTAVNNQSYRSNPQVYQRFIDQFGTHYFSVANFGGQIRSVLKHDIDQVYSLSVEQIKKNAMATFLALISGGGSSTNRTQVDDDQFTHLLTQNVRYYGGTPNLQDTLAWQATVDEDPWLYSGTLKPISDLMENDVQRTSMQEAVRQHVLRVHLAELRRLMTTLTSILSISHTSTASEIEARVADMEALPDGALVEADLKNLDDDINRELSVPVWFTITTQLCYKWSPLRHNGTCDVTAAQTLCALPGAVTPISRDEVDGNSNGCRTHWSIQAEDFEPWFGEIRVCYCRHSARGNGECARGRDNVLCVAVGQYSTAFKDASSGCGYGCQLSWSLSVPDSAPAWIRVVQLCFSWYADGDCIKCGESNEKRMCAKVDDWTSYYQAPTFDVASDSDTSLATKAPSMRGPASLLAAAAAAFLLSRF